MVYKKIHHILLEWKMKDGIKKSKSKSKKQGIPVLPIAYPFGFHYKELQHQSTCDELHQPPFFAILLGRLGDIKIGWYHLSLLGQERFNLGVSL